MNLFGVLIFLVGTGVIVLLYILFRQNGRLRATETELSLVKTANKESQDKIASYEKRITALTSEVGEKREMISTLKTNEEFLQNSERILREQFTNLGNKIFEDTTKKFANENKTNIENLLAPLRERIKDFDKKVTDTHRDATVDRNSLKEHIEDLKKLGEQMNRETLNLTTALKGESKTQGAWGEMILESALQMSGLRKDKEYQSQASFKDSDGNTLRPDVIVHLPEGRDVIVDSKVSLTAYEKYTSSENPEEKEKHIREHILSFRNHVKSLGSKKYDDIPEIRSLNYVLMFVPIESAFMLAVEKEQDLYSDAFAKNVIIVSPSTLLATLRTIHSLWQLEYQNVNAREIAESAGKMYDKFVIFVEHLKDVGKRISQSEKAYTDAMKSLSEGAGNLVGKAQALRDLGVKSSKQLPRDISEKSQTSEFVAPSPKVEDIKDIKNSFNSS